MEDLRREVEWFAKQMERRLKENDHKPGWKHDSLSSLVVRLDEEVSKIWSNIALFEGESDYEEIYEDAIDLGNFAMMVADVAAERAWRDDNGE